jgi:hypothetical protein
MRVEDLLAPEALAAIEAEVRGAERATSGEIVPVVVERSDAYTDVRVGAAAIVALALGGVFLALAPEHDVWLVPTQIGVFAALCWGFGWRPLLGLVAPNPLFAERVHRAASLAFHDAGMVETRDRTGKLLVVAFQGSLSPQVRTAAEMLRSGKLGSILNINAMAWQNWAELTNGSWRQEPALSGGGFLFDTGAHMMNTVSDLAGENFSEVAAWMENDGHPVDIRAVVMAGSFRGIDRRQQKRARNSLLSGDAGGTSGHVGRRK